MKCLVVGWVLSAAILCGGIVDAQGFDRFVRVLLMPETMSVAYPGGVVSGTAYWLFPGEPFVVAVSLSNNTGRSVTLLRRPAEWFDGAQFALRRKVRNTGRGAQESVVPIGFTRRVIDRNVTGRSGLSADAITVAPGLADRVRIEISPVGSLPRGVYEIEARVNADVIPADVRVGAELEAVELVGIAGLETRAELLNQSVNLAARAAMRGDTTTSREWLQKLLLLNPSSGVAFSMLGNLAANQRNFSLAVENWKKSIAILQTDGDRDAPKLLDSAKGDAVGSLQRRIQRCQ